MIEYHDGHLAICVKDRNNYSHETYSQTEINSAYESCKEAFWNHYAPAVAEKYGYGKVFSEGRSGGWLVVEIEPNLNVLPQEKKIWEDFSREILAEMDFCCNHRLIEVLKESRTAKEQTAKELYEASDQFGT